LQSPAECIPEFVLARRLPGYFAEVGRLGAEYVEKRQAPALFAKIGELPEVGDEPLHSCGVIIWLSSALEIDSAVGSLFVTVQTSAVFIIIRGQSAKLAGTSARARSLGVSVL
jgi:hypothetical protein